MDAIPLLMISGEGNEPKSKYQNIMKGSSISKQINEEKNEILIPGAIKPFIYSEYVKVEVSASCTYNPNSPELLKKFADVGIRRMTDEDWEFLKTGRCLNG